MEGGRERGGAERGTPPHPHAVDRQRKQMKKKAYRSTGPTNVPQLPDADEQIMKTSAGLDPSDDNLLMHLDHDGWRELGVDSGITRAKLLLYVKQQGKERREACLGLEDTQKTNPAEGGVRWLEAEPVALTGQPLALLSSVKRGFLDEASKKSPKAAAKASADTEGAISDADSEAVAAMAELCLRGTAAKDGASGTAKSAGSDEHP
jgi:hypothetical protein